MIGQTGDGHLPETRAIAGLTGSFQTPSRASSFRKADTMNDRPKLKVALIGDYPIFADRIDGGVQAVFAYLIDALSDFESLDLNIVTFKSDVKSPQRAVRKGYQLHVLPRQSLGIPTWYHYDFKNLQTCLAEMKPDVVHVQGAGQSGYAAIKSDYPTVITFHGILGQDAKYLSKFSHRLRLKLKSLMLERYCARHAAYAILISPYVRKYFDRDLRGKTYNIPNPVKEDYFNLPDQGEKGRVLFAGRIIPRKGVEDLLKAMVPIREKSGMSLILAGSLDDATYVKEIRKYVIHHGMSEQVSFLGHVSETRIYEEFSRCSLLVLPSYQETAPMAIQQAMAAGKPVIASNVCGIPYQIEDGVTGLLFEPGNVSALSGHLVKLLNDEHLRKKMGTKAKEKALTSFHAKRVAAATFDIYKQMAV